LYLTRRAFGLLKNGLRFFLFKQVENSRKFTLMVPEKVILKLQKSVVCFYYKLMEGKALRKHILHEKTESKEHWTINIRVRDKSSTYSLRSLMQLNCWKRKPCTRKQQQQTIIGFCLRHTSECILYNMNNTIGTNIKMIFDYSFSNIRIY